MNYERKRIMISVIMSTYKENESLLKEAIESILNQTYHNFEFIVILDNPENEMHKKVINGYAEKDNRIKFFVNKENIGLTSSLNKGLQLARGDYICRMDADDISIQDRFEKQYYCLVNNNYDLIGGITQMINESGKPIYSIKKIPTNIKKIKKALNYGQCIAHPTWFGKKEVFDTLQGYRNMPLCEDYDFTLRAILHGFKISNLNETVLKYRMTSDSISRSNLYEQYLYMKYITKEYSDGNIADINKAHNYVEKNSNPQKADKYLKANVVFNKILEELEKKQIFKLLIDGCKLLFISKDYLNKIYRYFMLTLHS